MGKTPSQNQYVLLRGGNIEERRCGNWWNVIVCQKQNMSCSPIYPFVSSEGSRTSHEWAAVSREFAAYQFRTLVLNRWEKLT